MMYVRKLRRLLPGLNSKHNLSLTRSPLRGRSYLGGHGITRLGYEDNIEPGDGWGTPVRIYPPRDRSLHCSVPKRIRQAFTEARICLRSKAPTAAAIMCRKTLEGVCSEHGVKSGTLAAQLKKLKENGVIEGRLFEWAEALRTIGNEAAHGVEFVVSPEDAQDTLEFTEALIEYVFTYRDKIESFKKRRAKASSPSDKEHTL